MPQICASCIMFNNWHTGKKSYAKYRAWEETSKDKFSINVFHFHCYKTSLY